MRRSRSILLYPSSAARWPAAPCEFPLPVRARSSARRLPKPRNRVSISPHRSSHFDGAIPSPMVPARMRSMKPPEIMNTSRIATCLSPALYARLSPMYAAAISKAVSETVAASASPASASARHSAAALLTPISPCASGRERFAGCRRSASRSAMSFMTYTALDTRQKAPNRASASATRPASSQPWPKTRPRKTNPFLIHWCGRIKPMSDLATGSDLRRASGSAEIALAEIAASPGKVPGYRVEALERGLQHPLPICAEFESTAQHDVKSRTRKRELPVFDGAEVRPVVGIRGRILAQHQDVPAVEPPEIGQDVVVACVRGGGAEYGHVLARMKGRDRRHRVSVRGEVEFLRVGLQLTEDFRHAGVIHDAVVETRALPGVERQHRRGDDRGDVECAERSEVQDRAPQLLARQEPARRNEKEGHEGEHPVQADQLDSGKHGEESEGKRK